MKFELPDVVLEELTRAELDAYITTVAHVDNIVRTLHLKAQSHRIQLLHIEHDKERQHRRINGEPTAERLIVKKPLKKADISDSIEDNYSIEDFK